MKDYLKDLRKENNNLEKNLCAESYTIVTDIIVYMKSQNICEIDIEIIRKDIIGMTLECQLRNKPLSSVIGEDYKRFTDDLIKDCDNDTFNKKILDFVYVLIIGFSFLFLVDIVFSKYIIRIISFDNFTFPITLGFVLSTLLLVIMAFFIIGYIGKTSFDHTQSNRKSHILLKQWIILTLAFSICILLRIFLKNIILFNVNGFIAIGVSILAYIFIIILHKHYMNKLYTKKIQK